MHKQELSIKKNAHKIQSMSRFGAFKTNLGNIIKQKIKLYTFFQNVLSNLNILKSQSLNLSGKTAII